MSVRPQLEEHIENLLIDQVTSGLDPEQELELAALNDGRIEAEQQAYMKTAALVQLGIFDLEHTRPHTGTRGMSAELRDRIIAAAEAGVVPLSAHRDVDRPTTRVDAPAASAAAGGKLGLRDLGWGLAAALAVALVLVGNNAEVPAARSPVTAQLAEATDVITVPWQTPTNPRYAAVSGEVQWSDSRQAGIMRLRGLPANDPAAAQYQLWIIDPERSAQPVDGGVFDIPAGATEAVIDIDAKLPVDDPTTFAITLEQPGGVVVSGGPLLVVATTAG